MKLEEYLDRVLNTGVPIVAISTPDIFSTIARIHSHYNDPIIVWDIIRGVYPASKIDLINKNSIDAEAQKICAVIQDGTVGNPIRFLVSIQDKVPSGAICILCNPQPFINEPMLIQAILNLRDHNKCNRKTLILLGSQISLPVPLLNDVLTFDCPYPEDEELRSIVVQLDNIVKNQRPDKRSLSEEEILLAVSNIRGLSAFQAEQHIAMALTLEGIDIKLLQELRYSAINRVPGLHVDKFGLSFDNVGGLNHIKEFCSRLFSGPKKPSLIVRVEEIEKALAGSWGDTSGVSQDALQVLLNALQDNEWDGLIAFGPPGSGKSEFSKALAGTFGCLSLSLDLGACKGPLVGESEQKIRAAISAIQANGKNNVFFIATCNRTDSLPAELRRRFTFGIWMFDLPAEEERKAIWKIHMNRFGIKEQQLPKAIGWSGANIYTCCKIAYQHNCSLIEASKYVIPAIQQNAEIIERIRSEAANRYLSASYSGVYLGPKEAKGVNFEVN